MTMDVEKGAAASSSDEEEGGAGDQQVLVSYRNINILVGGGQEKSFIPKSSGYRHTPSLCKGDYLP